MLCDCAPPTLGSSGLWPRALLLKYSALFFHTALVATGGIFEYSLFVSKVVPVFSQFLLSPFSSSLVCSVRCGGLPPGPYNASINEGGPFFLILFDHSSMSHSLSEFILLLVL